MKLEEAVIKAQHLRNLWKMEIHVMNNKNENDIDFDDEYFCVIEINLYIYIKHNYSKNNKVYYTAHDHYSILR